MRHELLFPPKPEPRNELEPGEVWSRGDKKYLVMAVKPSTMKSSNRLYCNGIILDKDGVATMFSQIASTHLERRLGTFTLWTDLDI